jgi:hypothetical protein
MGKVISMRPGPPESKEQWFKRKVAELGKALGNLPAPRRRLVHLSLNDDTPPTSICNRTIRDNEQTPQADEA